MDPFQVAAAYTNAVLLAILPHCSDFARRLGLPIATPITTNQVAKFVCHPLPDQPGGVVVLTNRYILWFGQGIVKGFRSPHAYFFLQDPDQIPRFYGELRMDQTQAVEFVRSELRKLGHGDQVIAQWPTVELAAMDGKHVVPHYRIKWLDPKCTRGGAMPYVKAEVNADKGKLEELYLMATNFWKPHIKVAAAPPAAKKPSNLTGGRRLTPISSAQSNTLVRAVLPEITQYAKTLGLPIELPVTINSLTNVSVGVLDNDPSCQCILTNGYRFNYHDGRVVAFYSSDCFFTYDWKQKGFKEDYFYGPLTVPEKEMVQIAKAAVLKLGYPEKLLYLDRPEKSPGGPGLGAKYGLMRYLYQWNAPKPDEELSIVVVEVDAKTKSVKSIYIKNPKLRKPGPKLGPP